MIVYNIIIIIFFYCMKFILRRKRERKKKNLSNLKVYTKFCQSPPFQFLKQDEKLHPSLNPKPACTFLLLDELFCMWTKQPKASYQSAKQSGWPLLSKLQIAQSFSLMGNQYEKLVLDSHRKSEYIIFTLEFEILPRKMPCPLNSPDQITAKINKN